MYIRYNKGKLSEILKNVYELLLTPISIFDGEFNYLTSYPPEGYLTEYCSIIRMSDKRAARCKRCDEESCARCKITGETFSYICHAGLYETITPIKIDSQILGYIIFGEYRLKGQVTDVTAYAKEEKIPTEDLKQAYTNLTVLSDVQVNAAVKILESCIRDFRLSDAISLQESGLASKIRKFINENLREPITVDDIAKNFFIGRTKLYSVFRDRYNISVKQYILRKRLERAKELLLSDDYSIAEIADKCGFSDYNNFIQRFKQATGMPPLAFKKAFYNQNRLNR